MGNASLRCYGVWGHSYYPLKKINYGAINLVRCFVLIFWWFPEEVITSQAKYKYKYDLCRNWMFCSICIS